MITSVQTVAGADPSTAPMDHSPPGRYDDGVVADAAAVCAGLAAGRPAADG